MWWIVYGRTATTPHPTLDCPEHEEKDVQMIGEDAAMWRQAIQWQAFGACFRCGFPLGIMSPIQGDRSGAMSNRSRTGLSTISTARRASWGDATALELGVAVWAGGSAGATTMDRHF